MFDIIVVMLTLAIVLLVIRPTIDAVMHNKSDDHKGN